MPPLSAVNSLVPSSSKHRLLTYESCSSNSCFSSAKKRYKIQSKPVLIWNTHWINYTRFVQCRLIKHNKLLKNLAIILCSICFSYSSLLPCLKILFVFYYCELLCLIMKINTYIHLSIINQSMLMILTLYVCTINFPNTYYIVIATSYYNLAHTRVKLSTINKCWMR